MTFAAAVPYHRRMRSPFRFVTRLVAVLSLVACVLVASLWMRSTMKMDQVRTADPLRQTTLVSANGEFCVETVTSIVPEFEPGTSIAHALPSQYGPRTISWQVAGLGAGTEFLPTLDGPIRYDTLMIPLWLVVVLLATPPVLFWDGRKLIPAAVTPDSNAF